MWRHANAVARSASFSAWESPRPHPRRLLICKISNLPDPTLPQTDISPAVRILDLSEGLTPYVKGWKLQRRLLESRLDFKRRSRDGTAAGLSEPPDFLLLMQHDHVYTLGRGADENHIKFPCDLSLLARGGRAPHPDAPPVLAPNGAEVRRVDRGGEVTYHGPGQLVAYPLLDLCRRDQKDLRRYLTNVEEVVIRTLARYGVEGLRDDANTGVWARGAKIAAVGVGAARWVTTHGLAVNVSPNMNFFDGSNITPCGLDGKRVTSLRAELSAAGREDECPCLQELGAVLVEEFVDVFGAEVVRAKNEEEIYTNCAA
eukprot:CAMPEP_0194290400 /NCGR_PEP_ID=MMETSP0169-20130528/41170_1 /TAXON_ID=218684 /ORGANISM="Corethron pennatum, Strain L29A3" /LENGTH=314 /DNA_ID=CAMNT_0039037969 /DNA_START=57 /DNA_END=1001 /DNA_ORIENTATION=-